MFSSIYTIFTTGTWAGLTYRNKTIAVRCSSYIQENSFTFLSQIAIRYLYQQLAFIFLTILDLNLSLFDLNGHNHKLKLIIPHFSAILWLIPAFYGINTNCSDLCNILQPVVYSVREVVKRGSNHDIAHCFSFWK